MAIYGQFLYGVELYGLSIAFTKKRFTYKVFDNNTFVTTWSSDVISEPTFQTVINGGPGQLKVVLDRPFDNFGEDVDVKINNRIDLLVFDRDNQGGLLLFRGFISGFTPVLNGGRESIEITILPFMAELQRFMLRESSGDTEVPFLSKDPTEIFNGVLSRFQADGGSLDSGTIDNTDTTVSYTFNTNTVKQAFDKSVQLAPAGWFWSVDPDGKVNFKAKPTGVTHDLSIGQHFEVTAPEKRTEGIVNRVYFTGGGSPPLFKVFERAGSISEFGIYSKKIVDQRVIVEATATTIATKILDEKEQVEVRTKIRVVDNNGKLGQGYNIESIKVGDTVRIKNLKFDAKTNSLWDVMQWDVDVWDFTLASVAGSPLLVVKTKYTPNMLEIETSSRFPEVSKRIEDINRNLEDTQTKDNPATPS